MSRPDDPDHDRPPGTPLHYPATPPTEVDGRPGMRSRWIRPPVPRGWEEPVLSEWELRAAGWSDLHPHTETNVVLDGTLYVESGGVTVVAHAGDSVTVPAGQVGRYWAPEHARMLAVYGPNPTGAETDIIGYWDV